MMILRRIVGVLIIVTVIAGYLGFVFGVVVAKMFLLVLLSALSVMGSIVAVLFGWLLLRGEWP